MCSCHQIHAVKPQSCCVSLHCSCWLLNLMSHQVTGDYCTFSLILWPLEQFVGFLPSDKVFKSGFNQTLGFVTQLPSIPILFYEKKGWSSSPADLNRVVWELLAGHACVYQHIWVPAQMNVKVDVSCGCWLECVMRVQAEHSHGSASALLGHTFPPFSLPATLFLSTFRGTGHLAWRGRWWG